MRLTWLLLATLFCLYLVSDVDSWRRRRFRFRPAVPRIRRITKTVRVGRLLNVRRIVRLPRVRRLVRLPSVVNTIGVSLLDKVVKLPESSIESIPEVPPVLPPTEPGPEPEPTLPTCLEICAGNCPKTCTTWNCPCQWVCPTTCEIFTKEGLLWPFNGFPAPLPCDFPQYDADNNTVISPWELAYHVRRRGRDDNNMMVFNKMDVDKDGNLTKDEFDSLLLLRSKNATVFAFCETNLA